MKLRAFLSTHGAIERTDLRPWLATLAGISLLLIVAKGCVPSPVVAAAPTPAPVSASLPVTRDPVPTFRFAPSLR